MVWGFVDLVHFYLLETLVDLGLLYKAFINALFMQRFTFVEILQSCIILRQTLRAIRLFHVLSRHRVSVYCWDIKSDQLIWATCRQVPSYYILYLSDSVLGHSWLLGYQLRLEGALTINTFRVNMFLAHQSMFRVVIQHRVLVNLHRRTIEERSVLRQLGGVELCLIVLINCAQVVELVWNVVGAFLRTQDAQISSWFCLTSSNWRWRFGSWDVIVIIAGWHMLHLILSMICYLMHHLFCFLFYNAFTLSIYPRLVVKHALFVWVHQILSRLFTILQFRSKIHQSQLSLAVLHRFAYFASRSTSAPSFLTKVGRFDDSLLNVGRCPILDHQFLEL